MKITTSDAIAILRLFGETDDNARPRFIEHLKTARPTEHTTIVSFRFQKSNYYIISDSGAEDNTAYLMQFITEDRPDIAGDFLANPTDEIAGHALLYRGKELYLFKVKTNKVRLDVHLGALYPDTSRSTWQKHIKLGHVTVNGDIITSPKHEITDTSQVAVSIPDATDYSKDELPIVYLDENIIVINKPIGVLTHAKGELNDEFTVADFFRRYTDYHLDTNRPGIVHRLDRDTSGILIGARNSETAHLLQKQFADRLTRKTYLAVLDGMPKQPEARIELPIGRDPTSPSTFRVDAKGKAATTSYKVLAERDGQALAELTPRTGRTHQLRVHMAYLNTPIKGDRVYGKPADRLYLHAWKLEVTIPQGERKVFTAEIPEELKKLFPEEL